MAAEEKEKRVGLERQELVEKLRELRDDDEALERISRAINKAKITDTPPGVNWPRARAAVDAIFVYLVAETPALNPPAQGEEAVTKLCAAQQQDETCDGCEECQPPDQAGKS